MVDQMQTVVRTRVCVCVSMTHYRIRSHAMRCRCSFATRSFVCLIASLRRYAFPCIVQLQSFVAKLDADIASFKSELGVDAIKQAADDELKERIAKDKKKLRKKAPNVPAFRLVGRSVGRAPSSPLLASPPFSHPVFTLPLTHLSLRVCVRVCTVRLESPQPMHRSDGTVTNHPLPTS